MTRWGRSAVGGIADALASPRAWLVALAAALIRGGIVALLLPVVVLPTTTGLAIVLGPVVASVVLGGPTAEATGIVAAAIALGLVWLVAGGLVAATADVWLISWFGGASVPDATPPRSRRRDAARVFVARLLAGVPLVFVLAWAVSRLVSAAYLELTNPSDLAAPVVVRILRQAPGAPIAVVVAWLVTEVVVAFAVRRIVLSGASVLGGLGWAVGTAVRHPIDAAATLLATTAATVLLVVPAAAASALAWGGLRTALIDAADPLATAVLALAFTGLWLGAVALLGVAAAVESALWTAEARRRLTGPVAAPETRRDVPAVPTTTVRPA